eukprot:m.162821 g.162821  ORF g.162821 m.162821 type:complete len:106 (+) comp14614_c0_seq1:59-376(+)
MSPILLTWILCAYIAYDQGHRQYPSDHNVQKAVFYSFGTAVGLTNIYLAFVWFAAPHFSYSAITVLVMATLALFVIIGYCCCHKHARFEDADDVHDSDDDALLST